MKWLDNGYCHDNGFFTSGISGSFEDKRGLVTYPAYYGGAELGKFREIADAKYAIEKAHAQRHSEPMPIRYPLGRRTGNYSAD